jgi:choline-glycine betaine transporter
MVEIWTKKHLVSDSNCNIVVYEAQILLQRMTNNVGLYLVLVTLNMRFIISINQDNWIGDTKYNI